LVGVSALRIRKRAVFQTIELTETLCRRKFSEYLDIVELPDGLDKVKRLNQFKLDLQNIKASGRLEDISFKKGKAKLRIVS